MPRPSLPLGTWGRIWTFQRGDQHVARAHYRDYDGQTRPVERYGASAGQAENRLREALRDRAKIDGDGEFTPESLLIDLGDYWINSVAESDKSTRTKETYRRDWERNIRTAIIGLKVFEIERVSRSEKIIQTIRKNSGAASARRAKVILSGICGLAVRLDLIKKNPIRETSEISGKRQKDKYDLAEEEWSELREWIALIEAAQKYDLIDMLDVFSGVGCRIGEMLAFDWPKCDFKKGTLAIEGTVIRETGVGLYVQEYTKSEAGMRTIAPPDWVMTILERRSHTAASPWVFPNTLDKLREPDNTRKQLRSVIKGTRWEGLHPHAFRHLVAVRLDAAGLSAREIADYLGHERPSMTQDIYMARKVASTRAASALAGFSPMAA
ncbi:site-specific integrase [Sciscionella sediminilitoris]|uniref:site-specific integrase n=1 Tax=Sciscionella sediminilitoris TaxID=1445613 RepID=UPI0009EC2AC7|nr:site-specific integrase [Sciscionella sp. SE31]